MGLRHLASTLAVCVIASGTFVAAQPKKDPPKKDAKKDPKKDTPVAPAKDTGSATATGGGSATGSATGPAVDDTPPKDMNGVDENPDRAHAVGMEDDNAVVKVVPKKMTKAGYPIEEAMRPITLPQNMSEVSIGPHAQISPYQGSDALRARYGITNKVQLGLTYVLGGIYDNPDTLTTKDYAFHAGKAVGLDLTVLLDDWIGVRAGVPVYIDPLAVSLQLGAPIKFHFGDKFALGGLDDLLTIKLSKFPPSFYQEALNAQAVTAQMTNTTQSDGDLRISGYGIYQYQPNTAFIGRLGFDVDDFSSNRNNNGHGGVVTFIRVGVQWSPRKYLDLGGSLGFDDLAHPGSFTPALFLAVRI